ncbi:hypothetical protein [Haloarchaeobius litoreus]|uniref:Uncharacterized protein n=1 Tax=Haloarchaeobius litoreus TaxID=755306 RepID=A0ABD6DIZ4_9EURY|nr:hypothetical protein [Haloarchaeobius litoreus]
MKRPSRRRLIAATGAAAASFSLAGCSSDSGNGDGTPTGTSEPTTDGTATQEPTTDDGTDTGGSGEPVGADQLARWVPVSDAFEFDVRAASYYDADLTALAEHESDFYTGTYGRVAQSLLGAELVDIVPPESREHVVQIVPAFTIVLRTSMSAGELATAVTDAGLSETGTQGDATIFEGAVNSTQSTVAVVEGVVVQSFGSNAQNAVETVLAARSGETARLLSNNGEVRTTVDAIGESELLVVAERPEDASSNDPSLDGAIALGYGWQFDADTSNITIGVTYTEGETAEPSALASYLTEQDAFSDYGNVGSSVEGRTVFVTGDIATNQFDLLSAGTPGESSSATDAPQVQIAFEFEDGTMTVSHDGGDSITASNLSLVVGDSPAGSQFADQYEEVTAGDSVSVDVSNVESGTNVLVLWSDGRNSQMLAQAQVP